MERVRGKKKNFETKDLELKGKSVFNWEEVKKERSQDKFRRKIKLAKYQGEEKDLGKKFEKRRIGREAHKGKENLKVVVQRRKSNFKSFT